MSTRNLHESILDPCHVFLTPAEVMARYRWGRTKGYAVMRARRDGFPGAVSGRYRLDTLMRWEEDQARAGDATTVTPLLPQRKRQVRKAAP